MGTWRFGDEPNLRIRGTHLTKTARTALEIPAKVPFLSSLGQEFLHERTHIDRIQLLMARDASRILHLCSMPLAGR